MKKILALILLTALTWCAGVTAGAGELALSGAAAAAAPDNAWVFPRPQGHETVRNVPDWGKDGFTLEVWCQPETANCGYAVLMRGSFGYPNFGGEKFIHCYLINEKGKSAAGRLHIKAAPQQYHYYVLSGTPQGSVTYRDGKAVRTNNLPGVPKYSPKAVLEIGYNGSWAKPFAGRIGMVRLHKRALSAQEVSRNYQALKDNQVLPVADAMILDRDRRVTGKFYSFTADTKAKAAPEKNTGSISFMVTPQQLADCTLLIWGDLRISATASGNIKVQYGKIKRIYKDVLRANVTATLALACNGKSGALFVDGKFGGQLWDMKNLPTAGSMTFGGNFTGTIGNVICQESSLLPARLGEKVTEVLDNSTVDTVLYPRNRHLTGKQEMFKPVIDFDDLTHWTVTYPWGKVIPRINRSKAKPLWSDYTLRTEFTQGDFPDANAQVVLAPPQPVKITEDFDTIAIWRFAPGLKKPYPQLSYSIQFRDSSGQLHDTGRMGGYLEAGWGIHMQPLKTMIKAPAEIVSITFTGFNQASTIGYLDSLHVYQKPIGKLADARVPSWEEVGVPTRPETILPTASEPGKVTLTQNGKSWIFESVTASGKKLTFTVTPQTGTLSDISANYQGKKFKPLDGGGFYWALNDIYPVRGQYLVAPGSPRVKARLLDAQKQGNKLQLQWQYTIDNNFKCHANWLLEVKDNTLIADLGSQEPRVGEFKFGAITGISGKVVEIPYLTIGRWFHASNPPGIFAGDGVYISAFVDWYNSDASGLFGESSSTPGGKWFLNPATSDHRWMPDKSVKDPTNEIRNVSIINGGSYYWPTTDGKRNPARERIMLTISDNLAAILPNIPNYKHKYLQETVNDVWSTRMWYVNKMPDLDHFDQELAMWQAFKSYGANKINIRFHGDVSRQYVPHRDGGPATFINELIDPALGGEKKFARLFREAKKMGFKIGIYTDHMLLNVFSDAWDLDYLNLDSNGYWLYSSGNTKQTKISRMVALQKKFNAIYRQKFGPNCAYLDQITCPPCWRYTDYDARTPDAAKFSAPYRVFVESLRTEEADFGPVLSEGRTQLYWAGLCDSYAQPQRWEIPVMPDFNLRKIHTMSNDCGYDLNLVAQSARRDGAEDYLYELLAYEYAYGSTGHLLGIYSGAPFIQLPPVLLRSYFLIQPAQKHYALEPVKDIFYNVNGQLAPVEAAIKAGTLATNQVKLVYKNGLEVAVNLNKKANFKVELNGKSYLLPPRGFAAFLPGKVEAYSALNSAGKRSSLMREGNLIYAVNPQDIEEITAQHDYALRTFESMLELTPTPFVAAETVSLKVPFSGNAAVKLLDRSGKVTNTINVPVQNNRIKLAVDGKAFRYQIEPAK
ncbi:MAG: LamG domain-containing protein [Lentisphaerae bacterium]|nr:LamG domain-containing protein [Lentisphaerota bacterium]